MLSAWLGGMGPALVATALAVPRRQHGVKPRRLSLVFNEGIIARLSIFLLVALFISALDARALDTIRKNALLQGRVIDDLVDLSRVTRGTLSVHMAAVDLRAIIEAAVEGIAATAMARGIKLSLDLAPECPAVVGDAARLQQAISNLLANALKHSAAGTTVCVNVDTIDAQVRIEVRDEGDGIAPDFLPHVFEPYRQAEGEIARSGLGLGLAIVRQIVELHGGRIEAASPGVGQGAGFTALLPIAV